VARRENGLAGPFTLSAIFHAAVATLLFHALGQSKPVALPPMYRVNIVAAPPGERAIGEVKSREAKATPAVTQPAASPSTVQETPVPVRSSVKPAPSPRTGTGAPKAAAKTATPTTGKTAPKAKVTAPVDAKVRTDGIEFAFPGYLNNIVRQIAIKFKPRNPAARLKAEVRFLIHRDGSVSDIQFIKRSGNFSFDLEAQGAVEAAASALAFGPLPDGFPDDALPVVFSFDPEFLK
jgi:protein TonB